MSDRGHRNSERDDADVPSRPHLSWLGILVSLLLLGSLIVLIVTHEGEARRFARLAKQAEPLWLLLALAFQLGTYLCAGTIWSRVAAAAGHRLPARQLARLSIEKLSVDQFVPTGGVSGNLVVLSAMKRMGLPSAVATEALLIDILSHYAAYATLTALTALALWRHHHITPVIISLLGAFTVFIAVVPIVIVWLLKHRSFQPRSWLARLRPLMRMLEVFREVSIERLRNARLLVTASALQMGVVLLDAATLWATLKAVGTSVHPLTTFAAMVIAAIAEYVSFLPGGIGSFEAGATATLALLGVPVEAALTGTLLLRGFTLWLPLVPGLLLMRRDLSPRRSAT